MVKADFTRDYYADLELSPNADTNEIKRQFKKLALVWHPDRNPGREAEVTTTFQKIQSAHEVLIDEKERARYDAGRIRTPRSFTSSTPKTHARGNPYANVGSQWPTPPKAPTARKAQPPPPSAGAQRYKNFETPRASAYNPSQEGAQARANMYNAWENMKSSQRPPTAQGSTNQGPASAQSFGSRRSAAYRQWENPKEAAKQFTPQPGQQESGNMKYSMPPKPKPTFDEQAGSNSRPNIPRRSQSTGPTKRAGFMPSDPEGDEPAAANTSAYFTHRNTRSTATPSTTAHPRPPPRDPPSARPADPLRPFEEPYDDEFEPRLSTPYSTHGGEKTNPFESVNIGRSKSTHYSPSSFTSQNPSSSSGVPRNNSDPDLASARRHGTAHPAASTSQSRHQPRPEVHTPFDDTSSDSESDDLGSKARSPEHVRPRTRIVAPMRKAATAASKKDRNGSGPTTSSRETRKPVRLSVFQKWYAANQDVDATLNGFASDGRPPNGAGPSSGETNSDHPIFSFKVDDNTFTSTRPQSNKLASSGAENISTKFSSEDWHGTFEAGDYFAPDQTANLSHRPSISSSTRARGRSPVKSRPVDQKAPQQSEEPQTPVESASEFKPQEEWAQYFKPPTFAPPPHPPPAGTASRAPRGAGRKPRVPRPTMGSAAVVDDDSSDGPPLFAGRKASHANLPSNNTGTNADPASPDAMDIDTPSSVKTPVPPTTDGPPMGSNAPVPPTPAFSTQNIPPRPQDAKQAKRASGPPNGEDLKLNLEELKQTEPIKQSASGLNSFDDLFASLPFQSKASLILPTAESFIPMAPTVPATLTPAVWADYVADFKTYLTQWGIFESRFVLHFIARKKQVAGLGYDWLSEMTDAQRDAYIIGLHEDQTLRKLWYEAAQIHEIALGDFSTLQHKAKANGV